MKRLYIITLGMLSISQGDIFLVTNNGDPGMGTLRWAILEANFTTGLDTIKFNAPMVIQPSTPLPVIIDNTLIDATDQWQGVWPGGSPGVELNGVNTVNAIGLQFWGSNADSSGVKGLKITTFDYSGIWIFGLKEISIGGSGQGERNVIVKNGKNGIKIEMAVKTKIQGNYIGIAADGITELGNDSCGIYILEGGSNQIQENVLSCNTVAGSLIHNSVVNLVRGNKIGTDANGENAKGNGTGVIISGGAKANQLGTIGIPPIGNLISGNIQSGILINGADSNSIRANLIGTDHTGNRALPNGVWGIGIYNGASGNMIGGGKLNGNIIAGNLGRGIAIYGNNTRENRVVDNCIGLSASGIALGNGHTGIGIWNKAPGTLIEKNIIVANARQGITIGGDSTFIYSNYIGTDSLDIDFGNAKEGILITARYCIVGDTDKGNTVAFNSKGIVVEDNDEYDFNQFSGNAIFSNDEIGLDLGNDGVTLNDSGDTDTGPNDFLNFPVIDSAITNMVWGTAPANSTVEIFLSDEDPSGYGEGKAFLGSGAADASGNFQIPISGVGGGDKVTATATDVDNNTSEFAANVEVEEQLKSITVTSPNGGENWEAGTTQEITWSFTGGIADVKLEYSINSGADWKTITASTPASGFYFWTIPDGPTTQARVKVTDLTETSIYDISDADFIISKTGMKEVNSQQLRTHSLRVLPIPSVHFVIIRIERQEIRGKNQRIGLRIYDISGSVVRDLTHSLTSYTMDRTSITWDGRDECGKLVPNGIYFCRLEANNYQTTKKLILLR